jgi:hypothetical protein
VLKNCLKLCAVAVGLFTPGVAAAAIDAVVMTNLNLNVRAGPGVDYERIYSIEPGSIVTVHECVSDYEWCDIEWEDIDGWVAARYLSYEGEPVSLVGPSLGIPVADFDGYDDEPAVAEANIDVFIEELAPHGRWVRHDRYDRIWIPAGVGPRWAPYTSGRWVYTRHGWQFVSYDPFGWATFHYGRWGHDPLYGGWYWVPGTVWAPAWVAWRSGPGYIGWAALPPTGTGFAVGFQIGSPHIPQNYWHFVPGSSFLAADLRHVAFDARRRPNVYHQTQYLGPVTVVNNVVVNTVIDVNIVERHTGQRVQVRDVRRVSNSRQAVAREVNGSVPVYQPRIRPAREPGQRQRRARPERTPEPQVQTQRAAPEPEQRQRRARPERTPEPQVQPQRAAPGPEQRQRRARPERTPEPQVQPQRAAPEPQQRQRRARPERTPEPQMQPQRAAPEPQQRQRRARPERTPEPQAQPQSSTEEEFQRRQRRGRPTQ